MSLQVTIEMADGTIHEYNVDKEGSVFIGRDASCDIVLPSPDVSRKHLEVRLIPGGYQLTDNSANGTLVGEHLLHRTPIDVQGGYPISVGPYTLHLPPIPMAAHASPVPPVPTHAVPTDATTASPHMGSSKSAPRAPRPQHAPRPMGMKAAPRPSPPSPKSATEPAKAKSSEGPKDSPDSVLGEINYDDSGTKDVSAPMRKRIHRMLLDHLDLASMDRNKMDDDAMRPKVRQALRRIIKEIGKDLPTSTNAAQLINEITDEALGLGPLERLLADDSVSEIMVVDPSTIYVERRGKLVLTGLRFTDDEAVRAVIERIVTPLGRRIDESTPLVDARLKDGSRVNAVIQPLAVKGSCITIRKFAKSPLSVQDLIGFGAMNEQMARFIQRSVTARKNVVISGGTGSGKTTLLNVLSGFIPEGERVVTVEDAAELQLSQPHVVSLESRPANMEGRGEYTIRDLVRNALRMRPDRIIVGECRGGEALDMLQAMNTGHEGSMTTTHSNSPKEAIARLETLSLMAGLDLPARAIREQIAQSIDIVLQQTRFSDGSRRITSITEVVGIDEEHQVELHEIFGFHRSGTGEGGKVVGEFRASGYLPSFLDDFIAKGLIKKGDYL